MADIGAEFGADFGADFGASRTGSCRRDISGDVADRRWRLHPPRVATKHPAGILITPRRADWAGEERPGGPGRVRLSAQFCPASLSV